jgi:hypothetical protein
MKTAHFMTSIKAYQAVFFFSQPNETASISMTFNYYKFLCKVSERKVRSELGVPGRRLIDFDGEQQKMQAS